MVNRKWLGAVLGLAVLVAACGSSVGSKDSSSSGNGGGYEDDSTVSSKPDDSSSSKPDADSTTLRLVDTALGKVVANSEGLVLYLYVPDGASPTSTVSADLLGAWPAVVATGAVTLGEGLDKVATTPTQPNGEKWVSYNDHLLYGFTGDAAPGDVNGNALGGVWYAVTAAGEPVQS